MWAVPTTVMKTSSIKNGNLLVGFEVLPQKIMLFKETP
jgi:hypothetical protein